MFLRILCFLLLLICKTVISNTVRLASPLNNGVGRVEIFHQEEWGTVCDDGFTDLAARVVCRQLGRYQSGFHPKAVTFGFGSGKVWLDDVNCNGSESSLANCSHPGWGIQNCDHKEDVGVTCDTRKVTVKLTPGYSSGLLQVYHSNSWGTVCADHFGKVEATVVCRTLGYESGDATQKDSSMQMWLDGVDCSMNNTDLKDCKHREWGRHNCSSSNAVGVDCYSFFRGSSAARLVSPRRTPGEGRLELHYGGKWGTVCTKGLGSEVANVVCRMLGHKNGGTRITSGFSFGSGTVLLEEVNCKGTETDINHCSHSKWQESTCPHSVDLGIRCLFGADTQRGIRLVSSIHGAGRVEVLYNNVWGTVSKKRFTVKEARVVCRMANLPWSGSYVTTSFGHGGGVIWLERVKCVGNETNLFQCSHSPWGTSTCSHDQDVGVVCSKAKLICGGSKTRGQLKIFYNNQWGTVCDLGFTNVSAKVACRMAGQPDKHAHFTPGGSFGRGRGRVWLSNVQCTGTETSLGACSHSPWGRTSCRHKQDVGVVCSYSPELHLNPDTDIINVKVGDDLDVECVVDDANPAVTSITWSHNENNYTGPSFRISNISKTDRGDLSCTATNGLGLTPGRAMTLINVVYSPEVNMEPSSDVIEVSVGNSLTVQCVVADANPAITSITWSHNGRSSTGTTFHIQDVTKSDEGPLTCTARNGVRISPGWANTFIRVLETENEPPLVRIEYESGTKDESMDVIGVFKGENLTVKCVTNNSDSDETTFTWTHNGRDSFGSTFHIQNVNQSDEGRLTCTVYSGDGANPGQAATFIRVLKTASSERQEGANVVAAAVPGVLGGAAAVAVGAVAIQMYRKMGAKTGQSALKGLKSKFTSDESGDTEGKSIFQRIKSKIKSKVTSDNTSDAESEEGGSESNNASAKNNRVHNNLDEDNEDESPKAKKKQEREAMKNQEQEAKKQPGSPLIVMRVSDLVPTCESIQQSPLLVMRSCDLAQTRETLLKSPLFGKKVLFDVHANEGTSSEDSMYANTTT